MEDSYQGQRIGLPREGVGAVASLMRRIAALVIDWIVCQLIAASFLGMEPGQVGGYDAFQPLGLFFLMNVLLVPTVGTTVGHRLMGVRVVSLDGDGYAPPPFGRSALRALLLCFFIPAIIMDSDLRGLHDQAGRSVVVRAR